MASVQGFRLKPRNYVTASRLCGERERGSENARRLSDEAEWLKIMSYLTLRRRAARRALSGAAGAPHLATLGLEGVTAWHAVWLRWR